MMGKNKYLSLIEKITELRNLLKYISNYDYEKLGEVIEILSDAEKNKNEDLMNTVKKYLSKDNFFNARWVYDWLMPSINGQSWNAYIYEIEELCNKKLHNKIENITAE